MHKDNQPLIFEITKAGRIGYSLPELDIPKVNLSSLLPEGLLREEPAELPEVSELDIMRHYT
ncbi:MAG TPA: aminomethyl-transferring glycine dehydrogenase subunit GcvPB, partial [Paenisporosarcina sp.]|nr:aminomethyl-transferring glycine dehydrogenase subunit GcvPB [Paenisporosarcina sp.]